MSNQPPLKASESFAAVFFLLLIVLLFYIWFPWAAAGTAALIATCCWFGFSGGMALRIATVGLSGAVCLVLVGAHLTAPRRQYNEAVQLFAKAKEPKWIDEARAGYLKDAVSTFEELGNYRDAPAKLMEARAEIGRTFVGDSAGDSCPTSAGDRDSLFATDVLRGSTVLSAN